MTHDPGPAFRALHKPGAPFILANAWDIGSARMLAALGAEALATSSAAHAFTLGQPDGTVTRDQALSHAADLVAATPLPVSGDFGGAFGAARLGLMAATGAGAEVATQPKIDHSIDPDKSLTTAFDAGHAAYVAARDAIRGLT